MTSQIACVTHMRGLFIRARAADHQSADLLITCALLLLAISKAG